MPLVYISPSQYAYLELSIKSQPENAPPDSYKLQEKNSGEDILIKLSSLSQIKRL